MHRVKYFSASLALGALLVAGLLASPASAATTTGTWVQYPTGATVYQTQIQQPINTGNTSNWSSKSKGAIPVMFTLSSGTGQAAFESIFNDNPTNTANDYAFVSFAPSPGLIFSQITNLSTTYAFTLGNCHGGSLRWEIDTAAGNLFIYYGDLPNFTDCTTTNQSGTNMINQPDLRYDTTQLGGTFYDTYANAVSLMGSSQIEDAALVIDSGWGGDQRLNISNTTVNDNAYQFVSSGGSVFTPTCALPAATIQVSMLSPNVDGSINEEPVQGSLADDGNVFRVVDCKYQYILSIPSLLGKGTYRVEILINNVSVLTPGSPGGQVKFDIK
jgi:hypothetical protein